MPTLNRFRVAWTGFSGAPGVSTFFTEVGAPVQDANPALKTFFEAIKTYLPSSVTIAYPTSADQLNDADGKLSGQITATAQAQTSCSGAGGYAGASGLGIKWVTPQYVDGRRLVGHTYLVPAVVPSTASAGVPVAGTVTAVQAAATALLTTLNGSLWVWSRPRAATPKKPARVGSSAPVLSAQMLPKYVELRSRRD